MFLSFSYTEETLKFRHVRTIKFRASNVNVAWKMRATVSFYDFTGFLSPSIFADANNIENSEQDVFAYHSILKMESENCFREQNRIF